MRSVGFCSYPIHFFTWQLFTCVVCLWICLIVPARWDVFAKPFAAPAGHISATEEDSAKRKVSKSLRDHASIYADSRLYVQTFHRDIDFELTDQQLEGICIGRKITLASFTGISIEHTSLRHLEDQHITFLSLSDCKISAEDFDKMLTNIQRMQTLKTVNFSSLKIGDNQFKKLLKLKNLTTLSVIDNQSIIDPELIKQAKRDFPNCKFIVEMSKSHKE